MIDSSKTLLLSALSVLALLAAGCSVSAAGEVPCVEDVSCPHDYPVCGPSGKCIAGSSTASASVAIVGADGHSPADFLSGTVRVTVSARASSGVGSVKLVSGSINFPAATPAAAPPLYAFTVDTTALADGDAALTASLSAGDGSTGTASGTLHVDNSKPVITSFTVAGAGSTTITSGTTAALGASFTPSTATAIVTSGAGDSVSMVSGGSALVSPDVATTYTLRVTSHSGVTVQSGTTGQPANVTVSVVSPATFTGNFTVSPSTIQQGQTGDFTFTAPTFGSSVVSGVVKDGANVTVGTVTSGGTIQLPIPATAPGTTQLAYSLVLSNGASTPNSTSIPIVVTVSAVPAPVIARFDASTVHTTSGTSVTWSLDVTGSTTGTPSVTGTCTPSATVPSFNIPLTSGSGTAPSAAPSVAATSTCTYTVTVNGATASSQAHAIVVVEPPPTVSSFTFQSSGTSAATFAPGTNVILNHAYNAQGGTASINGVIAGASGASTTFNNIQQSSVYTLTVTNLAGAVATATATATVSAQISSFSVGATQVTSTGTVTISNGATTKLFASFAGSGPSGNAAAALSCSPSCNGTLGATTISSGGNVTANGTINGALIYTLTVTPSSGTAATSNVTVNVVPPATATSLTAASNSIFQGDSTTLTPVFSFGTAVVPGTATIVGTDGSSYSNLVTGSGIRVAPSATVTYTLNVANAAGTAAATAPTAAVTVAPGTWSALNTATSTVRRGATVTALANGKVLIAGGTDDTDTPLDTADVCDATGTCVATTNTMNSPRAFHTATRIGAFAANNAGKVLLAGGFTATGPATPTTSADFYDPATNSFASTTAITTGTVTSARARHIAVQLNTSGLILIAGGTDGATDLNTALKYDGGTNATPTTANVFNNMAQTRASFTGTLLGSGSVLIVGGKAGNGTGARTAELFDPAAGTGTFSDTGALSSGEDKRSHTAALITGSGPNAGKVLISGGVTGTAPGTPSTTQFLYTPPPTGTFASVVALAVARSNHAAISLPTNSVLICGGTSSGSNALHSCERYDPATGTGNQFPTASMLEARKDFGLAPMTISSLVEILAAGGPNVPGTYAEFYDSN